MLLPIAVFLVVTVFVFAVTSLFVRAGGSGRDEVFSGGRRRPLIFGRMTGALSGIIPCPSSTREETTKDLRRAGFYQRFAFEEFAALRNAMIVGWVLLIGSLIVVAGEPGNNSVPTLLLVGLGGVIVFYSLPRLILRSKANSRMQEIQYGLPDALDMITMCMSGGLAMQQAMTRVSSEVFDTHPALACELKIIGRQMEVGSLDSAMRQFADRIDIPDVQSLTAMTCQTSEQGSNMASAFQEFADGVRRGRRQRAEERGNKTTIKLLLPLVFCLAPPVYMVLLVPAIMELRSFVLRENGPNGVLAPANPGSVENAAISQFGDLPFRTETTSSNGNTPTSGTLWAPPRR